MRASRILVAHRQPDWFTCSGLVSESVRCLELLKPAPGGCRPGNKARDLLCKGGIIIATITAVIKLTTIPSPPWYLP